MIGTVVAGHIGSDAIIVKETRLKFTIASKGLGYKDKNGEWQNKTTWVTVWSQSTKLQPYLKKGMFVAVLCSGFSATSYENKGQLNVQGTDIQWGKTEEPQQKQGKPAEKDVDDLPF